MLNLQNSTALLNPSLFQHEEQLRLKSNWGWTIVTCLDLTAYGDHKPVFNLVAILELNHIIIWDKN